MKVLLSNDDGTFADGLVSLQKALIAEGIDTTVVGPEREQSTKGHSLTLHKPLRIREVGEKHYSVSGTPADCVYIATQHILKEKPDLLISGINRGANLGQDIFYSGTVAAAREGCLLDITSLAISLVSSFHPKEKTFHWDSACRFVTGFLPKYLMNPLPPLHVLNINVPNLPQSQIKGIRVTSQGRRHYTRTVVESMDPRLKKYYWIGGHFEKHDELGDSDCEVVDNGYIALVPLKIDTTNYKLRDEFKHWEELKY
jgi:5'-nucleotidase